MGRTSGSWEYVTILVPAAIAQRSPILTLPLAEASMTTPGAIETSSPIKTFFGDLITTPGQMYPPFPREPRIIFKASLNKKNLSFLTVLKSAKKRLIINCMLLIASEKFARAKHAKLRTYNGSTVNKCLHKNLHRVIVRIIFERTAFTYFRGNSNNKTALSRVAFASLTWPI